VVYPRHQPLRAGPLPGSRTAGPFHAFTIGSNPDRNVENVRSDPIIGLPSARTTEFWWGLNLMSDSGGDSISGWAEI
jgi:hypothetical protein